MWMVWEVLWCSSLWREFISLLLCCKDLEFPRILSPWLFSKPRSYSVYYYFLQVSLPARWEGGSGSTAPAMAVRIWSWALSRKPLPSLPEVQLSSLPSLLHMFQLSLLLLQCTHSYNPHLLSLQEIQKKKIWPAYNTLTVFNAAIGIFPVKFSHHFNQILRGREGNEIHSIYHLEFGETTWTLDDLRALQSWASG